MPLPIGREGKSGLRSAQNGYAGLVRWLLRGLALVLLIYAGLMFVTYDRFMATPTGFVPEQDQGYLITVVQLPADTRKQF